MTDRNLDSTVQEYRQQVDIAHRKRLGQYFTPESIALKMVQWVLDGKPATILDPAFGLGIFFQAALRLGYQRAFSGIEIDSVMVDSLSLELAKHGQLHLCRQDYLSQVNQGFDAIVCNPPYQRFQNFPNRHTIRPDLERWLNVSLSGYTNMASIFLLKSLHELSANGRLSYIMPYEFLNADYGHAVKSFLVNQCLLRHLVLFDNEAEIFPDAQTTVCVLLCEKSNDVGHVRIHRVQSLAQLHDVTRFESLPGRDYPLHRLPAHEKWTHFIDPCSEKLNNRHFCPASHYGRFKRGLATGANSFFSLSQAEVNTLALHPNNLVPCIPKSHLIRTPIFAVTHWQELVERNAPCWGLRVSCPPDETTKRYLRFGESKGFHLRYLTRTRPVWYQLEHREPAPLWFGAFGRDGFKVIHNRTDCLHFTCFHGFYPHASGTKWVERLFLFFLSDLGQNLMARNQRHYGAKLKKLEPGDLNTCLVPNEESFERFPLLEVQRALYQIEETPLEAKRIANRLIASVFPS
ncbi:MAG: N-6 DNA methylase [Okeania sp. SIO1H5]|uniref:HsdM family class I SAM-dependent methyltransferase n=1 Tax=Okeania sp. SIO1H5 TaxID=2607777 RepID=UPI0013BB0D65|nr:N-6 DNA methylase [Okeania sp. SIO1H5]NET23761.1 N-6 DNA methylase [Okeania sp. SIO1H5]